MGILYGAITIAVPYPDPTKAPQLAYQARHNAITDWMLLIGLTVFTLGLIYIPVRIGMNRKRQVSQ